MNLATIQRINKITPIKDADAIELAHVLGWQVVVKKGEYKEGDLCTYIQIDTIVPETPMFEFLRPYKFRVKTIKLRKELSQGLIVPVPEGKWKVGQDVSDIIGVKKYNKVEETELYEKPRIPKTFWKKILYKFKYNILYKVFPQLKRKQRSKFPTNLVPITDEERIQNIPQILDEYKGKEFVVSYKLDGSSITIIHEKWLWKHYFRICSRRFELHNSQNDWTKGFNQTNFQEHILKLVKYFQTNDIIVQGELIGPKFNGNHHGLKSNEIRLFNIYVKGKRINQKRFIDVCLELNIPHCPLYKITTLNHNLQEIIDGSNIKDILNPKVPTEGLVWRCIDDNRSFKVINNDYLLKCEK